MEDDEGTRPRTPLSARLGSLFNQQQDNASESDSDSSMLSARTASHAAARRAKHSNSGLATTREARRRSLPVPLPYLQTITSPSMTTEPAQPKSPTPVLRWSQAVGKAGGHRRRPSGSGSNSPTSASGPPSPNLTALNEALQDDLLLPTAPPQARLPSSFYASRALSRPPPFLDNLTRSTLPTASLSPGLPDPNNPNTTHSISLNDDPPSPTASIISSSPPGHRNSIDTLRSVRDRGIHTSAPVAMTSPTKPNNWQWWFQAENKKNVDKLLDEDDRADSVTDEQENFRRKYRSPKNPIVFCHGLMGFDTVSIGPSIAPLQVTHWRGIKEVLEANGIEVLITRVPATSSPVDRAKVLEKSISEAYAGRSVHLIGHSMGGLDCRYLATHLTQRKFQILSITTIATPHRGSYFADYFLSTVGSSRMPSVLSLIDLLPNGGGDGKAFESLTLESMRAFNEDTPDVEEIKYYSWGAWYEPGLIDTWKFPHSVIMEKEGANDGMVSVESSKWGQYLGTLEDVNHLDLVGWVNTARYKWASLTGREIKFRPATFYLGIADWLAGDVEGIPKQDEEGKVGDGVQVNDGVAGGKPEPRQEQQEQGPDSSKSTQVEPGVLFDADEEFSPTPPPNSSKHKSAAPKPAEATPLPPSLPPKEH